LKCNYANKKTSVQVVMVQKLKNRSVIISTVAKMILI
jgi:hypothetical protein